MLRASFYAHAGMGTGARPQGSTELPTLLTYLSTLPPRGIIP
jgi:hypothetical protein